MAQPQISGTPSTSQLEQVAQAVRDLLHQPDYDDGSAGPVLVRLAWHSAGTYDAATKTGGSNGAGMRYEAEGGDAANAGLQHARAFLEPIKKKFPWITYADLWTLAAVVAIKEMGGPSIKWRGGRTDFADDSKCPPRGRLPDGSKGADHLRHIFYRMGFNDQEIVALSGAHNLGRCHSDRSGFEGKWVNNPTRFSNTYFKMLLVNDWRKKRLDNGLEQYVYVDEDAADEDGDAELTEEPEELMMLPTDIALIQDLSFMGGAVFAKLLELGITRDKNGNVINDENQRDGYRSAPKKSDVATAPKKDQNRGQIGHEAKLLKEENDRMRRRREGARL